MSVGFQCHYLNADSVTGGLGKYQRRVEYDSPALVGGYHYIRIVLDEEHLYKP